MGKNKGWREARNSSRSRAEMMGKPPSAKWFLLMFALEAVVVLVVSHFLFHFP